jgi:hypothetical protein
VTIVKEEEDSSRNFSDPRASQIRNGHSILLDIVKYLHNTQKGTLQVVDRVFDTLSKHHDVDEAKESSATIRR